MSLFFNSRPCIAIILIILWHNPVKQSQFILNRGNNNNLKFKTVSFTVAILSIHKSLISNLRHVVKRGLDWTCKTRTGLKFVKRGLDSNL